MNTTPSLSERLLPCPFCGGKAELDSMRGYMTLGPNSRIDNAVAIYCLGCGADHSICRADRRCEETGDLIAQVVEAWNNRTPVAAEIARLQGEVAGREPEVRCLGCGSPWTNAELARQKKLDPKIISCCPERQPLTIDDFIMREFDRVFLPAPATAEGASKLCDDCPPVGYPTDKTRCLPCPRRSSATATAEGEVDAGELVLHDQKEDAAIDQFSVQTMAGGVLFMFNEVGITAREVFATFCRGRSARSSSPATGEG